jgi:hypothetical protein
VAAPKRINHAFEYLESRKNTNPIQIASSRNNVPILRKETSPVLEAIRRKATKRRQNPTESKSSLDSVDFFVVVAKINNGKRM